MKSSIEHSFCYLTDLNTSHENFSELTNNDCRVPIKVALIGIPVTQDYYEDANDQKIFKMELVSRTNLHDCKECD